MIFTNNKLNWIDNISYITLYLDIFTIHISKHGPHLYHNSSKNDIEFTWRIDGAINKDNPSQCLLLKTSTSRISNLYLAKKQALESLLEIIEENNKDIKKLIAILPIKEKLL